MFDRATLYIIFATDNTGGITEMYEVFLDEAEADEYAATMRASGAHANVFIETRTVTFPQFYKQAFAAFMSACERVPVLKQAGLFGSRRLLVADALVLGACLIVPAGVVIALVYCLLRMWVLK